ncbi:MAG: tRNA1(Val) (adenine(37)-N6)-methyltransferase [Bacteroidaceae bacterium]
MSQPFFRFRQFLVRHDTSSMPVGTDGVLLGAWADLSQAHHVLDVGTGCGLIALMAAQRAPQAKVEGIDIDMPSVKQARQNVADSPFASRVRIHQCDVREFVSCDGLFDCILSNPPFYINDVLPPAERRMLARNASALPMESLLDAVMRLLSGEGLFSVVLPSSSQAGFVGLGLERGLFLARSCQIHTVMRKPPKRVMLEFSRRRVSQPIFDELFLQDANGSRSAEYQHLTEEFYL